MVSGENSKSEDKKQEKKGLPEIIYKLEDESVSLNNAPAQLVAGVLFNLQGLIYSVAHSTEATPSTGGRRTKRLEDLYSLNVKFEDGCLAMRCFPPFLKVEYGKSGDKEELQTPVFKKTAILLTTLSNREVEYDWKLEIVKQIEDPRLRFPVFNHLRELIPADKEAEIRFRNVNGDIPPIKLHDVVFKSRVLKLLREGDIKNYRYEVLGVISRFKGDLPSPYFMIKDWTGKLVKIDMPEEKRHQILDLISADMVPIKLTGVGTKKKLLEISDIDEIEVCDETIIDFIHGINLKAPIKVKISYERIDESEYAIIGSDEFGAYGVDSTVNKAIEMLKDDIYNKYITYKDLNNDRLTEKALELKTKLIDLFGK